ncbi:unnamed protein product [Cuscuta campestris]|uniref:Retrotransposon gag domain-containing protein n=1 Tax=Cuscuta campestris TaxID=132261 RepID=A0A484LEH1_9ASTE|nr:unnamed protein product [Cuscuta campestris]
MLWFSRTCQTFRTNGVSADRVKLSLFPFSLRDRAARWLNTFSKGHFTTWEALHQAFMHEYFPPSAIAKIKRSIQSFSQNSTESLSEAWERFKDLNIKCPPALIDPDSLMFHFYQGLLVSSKKELDHSSKVGSFLDMTPEENEELVEKLTSNAKYWYEDRVPQQKAGMYEVDTFTALKASMESLIKRTIQDQFSASSHPNKQHESIAQADAYYQGGSSSHQNELVLSCESCTGAHLTSQCPYNESTTKERPREVHLAQYANKGEGPWAPNQYQPAYQRDDPSRERNNNNFQRNNRSRDDYKQGGWNNNINWNSQRGSGYNQGGNTQVYVPPHQRQAEDPMAEMKRMMEEQNKKSEERIQRIEESMRQIMDKMTIRPPRTLPAKTETNPREHLNAVTLRSGKEVQGVGQSTEPTLEDESEVELISQPTEEKKKEPENKEERKDKEPSQSQHPNSNLLPKKVTVPFPSRVKKKNDDQAFKKFLDIMGQVEVKLPLIDVLTEMPKYAKFIKDLVMHKKDWEGVSMINLNASCSALLLQQLPEKCKDPVDTKGDAFASRTYPTIPTGSFCGKMAGAPIDPFRRARDLQLPLLTPEAQERFTTWAQHRSLQALVILDQRPLVAAGVWAYVEASIRPSGWERLLSLRAEASLPLTIEFLCSLRPLLGFERRDDVGIAMRHDSRLIFTLLGQRHTLTVAELGWRLGIYTQEEISHSSFADLPITVPEDFDVQAFWTAHARTDAPFEHQLSRASDWAEPSWRLLTFLMSMSYFGRPSNSNRVYSSDMLFFWSIAHQRQVNLAVFIARFLWSQTYGTRITVVCGPLITLLHSTMIQHIRLQRSQIRRIRPREGPSPRPHPAPQPQSTFQQGQSSTGVENLQIPLWAQTLSTQMQSLQYNMSGFHGRLEELHTRFTEFEQRYEADMTRLIDQQEAQWTNYYNIDFDPSVESPLVPVWVGLEGLPIHLFDKPTLFSIAKLFGSPLQTDAATVNLSRPNVARVCVEVNLSKELPKAIWIHLGSSSYLQPLLFENLPSYCNSCHQLGHKSCKSGTRNSRWVRKTKPRGKAVAPGQQVCFPSSAAVPTSTTPITFGSFETGHQYVTTKDIGPCPTMSKNGPPPRLDSTALAPITDANLTLNGPPLTGLDSTPLSLLTDANLDAFYLECAQHQDTKDSPLLTGPCELEFTKEGPFYPVEQNLSPQILPQSQNDGYDPNHTDENMRAHETHRESSDGTPSDTTVPPIGNDDALSDPSTHTKVHAGKDDEAGKDALSEAEPVSPHTQEGNTNISFEPRSFCRYIKVTEQRSSPSLQEFQKLSFTEQIAELKRGHQQLNFMQPKTPFQSIQGIGPKLDDANLFEVEVLQDHDENETHEESDPETPTIEIRHKGEPPDVTIQTRSGRVPYAGRGQNTRGRGRGRRKRRGNHNLS